MEHSIATVVALGAGLGGALAAQEIKQQLRPKDELAVVSKGDAYRLVRSKLSMAEFTST